MDRDAPLEPEEFARAFQRLLDWVGPAAERQESFAARLTEHFGADAWAFPATRLEIAEYDRPNLQLALDAFLAGPDRSAELLGFAASLTHMELSLSQLMARSRPGWSLAVGPVARTMVELDEGRSVACVTMGLLLISAGSERLAVLIANQRFPAEGSFVEVMAPQLEGAEAFLSELRRLMVEHNVYRRKVISLAGSRGPMGQKVEVTFHARRRVSRDRILRRRRRRFGGAPGARRTDRGSQPGVPARARAQGVAGGGDRSRRGARRRTLRGRAARARGRRAVDAQHSRRRRRRPRVRATGYPRAEPPR